jgi:peptidoglycan/LPS O-acetylase OafA/YrhL
MDVIGNEKKRIDSIQVLRVFGAFTISLSHIPFILEKCNIVFGVDIFLIITGYLAMYTTQLNDKMVAWRYVTKKAIRLLPIYWLITLAAFFAAKIIPGILNDEPTIIELIKSMLLIPYTRNSRITETTVIRPIVGPAHTLMYDVYFYFVFIIAAKVDFKKRGFITAIFISFVYIIGNLLPIKNVYLSFYSSPWTLDLALGILLFYIVKLIHNGGSKHNNICSICFIICAILCSVWLVYEGTQHLSAIPYIFRKSIPAFVLVLTFMLGTKEVKFPQLIIRLGDMSYSYYLIHYFCLMFVSKFVIELTNYSVKGLLSALAALLVTVGISYISWNVIEKRFSNFLLNKLPNEQLSRYKSK